MTKIAPHYNCLNGEHVFIPNRTWTDTRNTRIESFVCTHCLVEVSKRDWEVHLQELKRISEGMNQTSALPDFDNKVSESAAMQPAKPYIPTDYKEIAQPAAKKAAPKAAPKKA